MTHVLGPEDATPISPAEFADALGLALDQRNGHVGLARLVRAAVGRWGTPRRRDVVAYARRQLRACGADKELCSALPAEVVDGLVALREIDELRADGQKVLVPGLLRLVVVGPELGLVLGCRPPLSEPPEPLPLADATGTPSMARWVRWTEEAREVVAGEGGEEWTLADWLGALDPTPRSLREAGRPALPLEEVWRACVEALEERGAAVSDPSAYRVLAGDPGGYYGKREQCSGRWLAGDAGLPTGVWCGARPGYHERHWHPCVVDARDGRASRSVDLYDWEEYCWVLLSRGRSLGAPERLVLDGGTVERSCPLPARVGAALGALGIRDGWQYRTHPTAAEALASLLEEAIGVVVTRP